MPRPEVQLLRRGGHVGILLPQILLLSGGEAAGHAGLQESLLGLQGQKAQGGQIDPRGGAHEPLEAGVGLAGVGAPQVEDEAAVHGTGLRVLILGVQGDEEGQVGADGPGHMAGNLELDRCLSPPCTLPLSGKYAYL